MSPQIIRQTAEACTDSVRVHCCTQEHQGDLVEVSEGDDVRSKLSAVAKRDGCRQHIAETGWHAVPFASFNNCKLYSHAIIE